ncbi:hypothetical protein ACCP09_02275 [Amycolatopsis sp. 3B14]
METKIDERQALIAVLDQDRGLLHERPGLLILADKGYLSRELDTYLTDHGVHLLRPSDRNLVNRSTPPSTSPPPSGTTAPPANPQPDP